MLLARAAVLLCLQQHTIGSQFLSVAPFSVPFDSPSFLWFTMRQYIIVFPTADLVNPAAQYRGMEFY